MVVWLNFKKGKINVELPEISLKILKIHKTKIVDCLYLALRRYPPVQVEVDPDAMEKLMVTRSDFLHALENDIKPAFGAADEVLEGLVSRGIINWGEPIKDILADGKLLIQQVGIDSIDIVRGSMQ